MTVIQERFRDEDKREIVDLACTRCPTWRMRIVVRDAPNGFATRQAKKHELTCVPARPWTWDR